MKTFLSIGAGPGIGYATAERFAREGFVVILAARNASKLGELAARLASKGFQAHAKVVDAADANAVAALIQETEIEFGTLDVVHYNAAHLHPGSVLDQQIATFNTDLAVNIGGALAASQAALKTMFARGRGALLFTGGGWGVHPNPEYISISIGKAGVRALTLGLFPYARSHGVHVGSVTVAALIEPDSAEATGVADTFWALYLQPEAEWVAEMTFSG
jgi:short-subunit dehydrogenase